MEITLDTILDLVEPVMEPERAGYQEEVARTAARLRTSGIVARPASDRDVVVAGILAYGTLARAQGYEAAGLEEEMAEPLRALLGEQRAAALLGEWRQPRAAAAGRGRSAARR